MFNVTGGLAEAMKSSENYKIVLNDSWLYVFPADTDFDTLANHVPSAEWDKLSVLTVDDDGVVRKSRYGVSG